LVSRTEGWTRKQASAAAASSSYDGRQTGDPAALGEVLAKRGTTDNQPKQLIASTDAIAAFKPVLAGRLAEIEPYRDLSRESFV